MTPKYFNSIDTLSTYAGNYPANSFKCEPIPQKCACNGVRVAFEVTDRQDNDIIEILILCPACADKPKNRQ